MLYSYLNPPHTTKKTDVTHSKIFERKREKEKPNRCLCGIQMDDCCIPLQKTGNRTFIVKKATPPALNPSNWAVVLVHIALGVLARISVQSDFLQDDYWPRNGRNLSWLGGAEWSHFWRLCGVTSYSENARWPKNLQYLWFAILVAGS